MKDEEQIAIVRFTFVTIVTRIAVSSSASAVRAARRFIGRISDSPINSNQ